MKINARGISYQFSDSDGSTQLININLSGSEASDYISSSFAIKPSDLTDGTTLDSLNKKQITALGLKKMEDYVKAALSEA